MEVRRQVKPKFNQSSQYLLLVLHVRNQVVVLPAHIQDNHGRSLPILPYSPTVLVREWLLIPMLPNLLILYIKNVLLYAVMVGYEEISI